MSNQTLIEEYPGIISEIQTEIKKLENDTRVLNKLYVINIQTLSSSQLSNQYIMDYLSQRSLIKTNISNIR